MRWTPCVVIGWCLLSACASRPAPVASDPSVDAAHSAPSPGAGPKGEPEACHVFTIVGAPTIESTKVGSFAIAGSVPSSVTTIMWADGGTAVTTMAEIETTLCRVLPRKPYLVHLMKEKGHFVGDIYTPTATADPAADARTICDAPARGARLGASADDQLSMGLSDAAGSLTSRKYRDLLFAAMGGDERASMGLVKALDHDIRLQGDEAFERCTVLVKKKNGAQE